MKLILTAVVVALYLVFNTLVVPFLRSTAVVGQLADNGYVARAATEFNYGAVSGIVALALMLGIWLVPVIRRNKRAAVLSGTMLTVLLMGACKPYETPIIEKVGANETVFLVPYEAATSTQTRLLSEEYLNSKKIAAKQITITQHNVQTGYQTWQLVPDAVLIRVDRTPAVRAWTKSPGTGTSSNDEAITVESNEGIGFRVGVNASAGVSEDDAAKFLYYFAGSKLGDVVNLQVREYVQNQLFADFSTTTLGEINATEEIKLADGSTRPARTKRVIFSEAEKAAKKFFADKGITIDYVGGADEITYINPAIQDSIDKIYVAQRTKDTNDAKAAAQAVQNNIDNGVAEAQKTQAVSKAKGVAEATSLQADAEAHALKVKGDELKAHPELITYQQVGQGWNGQGPSTVVQGNGGSSNANVPVIIPAPSR